MWECSNDSFLKGHFAREEFRGWNGNPSRMAQTNSPPRVRVHAHSTEKLPPDEQRESYIWQENPGLNGRKHRYSEDFVSRPARADPLALSLVRRAVTSFASRNIWLPPYSCKAVHAGEEILYLFAVTRCALLWCQSGRFLRVVRRPMAARAGIESERAMHTLCHFSRLIRVAGCAIYSCNAFRMGKFLNLRVACGAIQHCMHAGFMFGLVNRNAPPGL